MTVQVKTYVPGMTIEPGFYEMDAETYHSRDGGKWPLTLNASTLKTIAMQSAKHAYHNHPQLGGNVKETSSAMDTGTLAHCLILDRGRNIVELPFENYRTKDAQTARDEARENGYIPVLPHEIAEAKIMAAAFDKQTRYSAAHGFYKRSTHSEIAAIFELDGVLCQCLFDRVNLETGEIFDIKTTKSCHPKPVAATIFNLGYDIQEGFYKLALETLIPEIAGRSKFTFLFVEVADPYVALPVQLSGEARGVAQWRIDRAIKTWKECASSGVWPAYGTEIYTIDPPAWAVGAELAEVA